MLPTSPQLSPSHDSVVQLEVSCEVLQRLLTQRGLAVCELRCLSADSRQRVRDIVKACATERASERQVWQGCD